VQNKDDSVKALVYVASDDAGTISEGPLQGMTVAVKDNICTKNNEPGMHRTLGRLTRQDHSSATAHHKVLRSVMDSVSVFCC
jgi:Asp-tRNA(Asn)/Glu-tRNA(Gln) amidotransferase A subunit family amidase